MITTNSAIGMAVKSSFMKIGARLGIDNPEEKSGRRL